MCELQIMATKGPHETPAWMQLSEVALYGPGMAPLTISSASADCENTDASEGADQAVDGDTSTKWLCSPFVYGAGESVCENTCPGVPSWASDGYCDGAAHLASNPRTPDCQITTALRSGSSHELGPHVHARMLGQMEARAPSTRAVTPSAPTATIAACAAAAATARR